MEESHDHDDVPESLGSTSESDSSESVQAQKSGPAFTRVCRRCSAQATTDAPTCPACGARYARRRPSRRLTLGTGGAVVLLLIAAAGWAVLDKRAGDKRAKEQAARIAAQKKAAEEQAAEEAEAAAAEEAAAEKLLTTLREGYVLELRRSITKHAQKAYDDGLLDGRATGSSCDNTDGNESDEDADSAAYDCMAITKHNGDGTASGYQYTGRINYDDGTMTWQIGG